MAMKPDTEWFSEIPLHCPTPKAAVDTKLLIRRIQADVLRSMAAEHLQPNWLSTQAILAKADQLDPKQKIVVERYITEADGRMRVEGPAKKEPELELCPGCGNDIQSDVCWCGEPKSNHSSEHGFVPIGCDCGRSEPFPKKESHE